MARIFAPRRLLLIAGLAVAVPVIGGFAAGAWLRARLRASLPALDGSLPLPGLEAPVTIERDALGVPTVHGTTRADVARATGFLHAQDRFFQMDLLRRRAAGELAELFGPAALDLDRPARVHGFRSLARKVAAAAPPDESAALKAYADGVNAGLAALGEKPFEYLVLRGEPRRWLPEDSVLVAYAMTLDLEDDSGGYARTLAALNDRLGPRALAFFAPLATPDDAALDGSKAPLPPIPSPTDIDLRRPVPAAAASDGAGKVASIRSSLGTGEFAGSNCFAVSGAHAGGGAILANDMHLRLSVPDTWYRASLEWPGHRITGVTLPGTPLVVAGSNGRVAWGFTNAYAETGDLVIVAPTISPDLYHGPNGTPLPFEIRREVIVVKDKAPFPFESRWTVWGPIVADGPNGTLLAYRWTADDPSAMNLDLIRMEEAGTAADAVAIAHASGIPAQNFVVADSAGNIGWTIAGKLPNRTGRHSRSPVSALFGDRRWDGMIPSDRIPTILAPPSGFLWTANNRPLGGPALDRLGDGGYANAARAAQIRNGLIAAAGSGRPVTPLDLLSIQLDDRALFLERWHALLLDVLNPAVVAAKPSRAVLRHWAEAWEGRASVGSISYGIVRAFRLAAAHRVLDPIFAPCVEAYPAFNGSRLNYEDALWTLLHARPSHLLDPAYATWDDLLAAAADDASADLSRAASDPSGATWGSRNTTRIVHPFFHLLPEWLANRALRWLAMPAEPVPGDANMPRIQQPAFGASERFAVSPGRENEGVFHMPGGQSANPLSPYFTAGYGAWVRGDPLPFLPGRALHSLELLPAAGPGGRPPATRY